MTKWFYDHLARLIYANAVSWRPMHVTQLREYVDNERQTHYLEGYCGEYILPNSELAEREGKLYADIEAYEDGQSGWHAPTSFAHELFTYTPPALDLAQAFSALGIFSLKGLRAVADIWNAIEFRDTQGSTETRRLHGELVGRIISLELPTDAAEQKHVDRIYGWQMPMYNLDFGLIPASLDELQRERDAMFFAEMGDDGDF
ncbi:MAG: hypothetical protein ACREC1_06400 [Methylovirgula sp.]